MNAALVVVVVPGLADDSERERHFGDVATLHLGQESLHVGVARFERRVDVEATVVFAETQTPGGRSRQRQAFMADEEHDVWALAQRFGEGVPLDRLDERSDLVRAFGDGCPARHVRSCRRRRGPRARARGHGGPLGDRGAIPRPAYDSPSLVSSACEALLGVAGICEQLSLPRECLNDRRARVRAIHDTPRE